MDKVQIRRALISVFDKTGIVELAKLLHEKGIEIISTGGTAKSLRDAGIPLREVSDLTGFPEMMDGRLKTLHPKVHGGLLAIRSNKEHMQAMDDYDIVPIDLLVVNLYPFGDPNEMARLPYHEAVERIDIGGPAMIRAAAKNHGSVAVVTHPRQYPSLHERIATDGATSGAYRAHLMRDAFKLTFEFDKRVYDSFSLRTLHNS